MKASWTREWSEFKSPMRVVVQFLQRSRERKAEKARQLKQRLDESQGLLARREAELQQYREEIGELKRRVERLKIEKQIQAQRTSIVLPDDPPIGTHGYGTLMISLAVNVARSVGFRSAEQVLRLFFEWLGVEQQTPTRTSIRNWLQRLGIAEMQQPLKPNEDLVVMVDHSNQIGTEKVLVALGVNAKELPESGKPLKHEDVRVLDVKPGSQWKTADMEQEYEELADRYGPPRAVLSDGAVELQEGAQCLKNRRNDTIVLRDFKHYAANVMKSLIGNDERFQEVAGKIGKTRSAIQQTELAHLTPPSPKQKARFMNLASTIHWMSMIAWLLKHPEAKAREGISDQRMQNKLGWVESYAADVAVWHECQDVVSASLTFINEQYLFKGAANALRKVIGNSLKHDKSKALARRLIDFVHDAEQQLRADERLPMSTEILESAFGLYKQLEGQHSKSGFTSLLACFPALLKPTTPAAVNEAFQRVSAEDVKAWIKRHFGSTVTSRRQAAYAEYKSAFKSATVQPATS